MAAVLASHSCCRQYLEPSELGRARRDISFSASISTVKYAKLYSFRNNDSRGKEWSRFVAEVRPQESDKLGSNGRAIKMVPTEELMRSRGASPQRVKSVNGSKASVNGSKVAINGSRVVVNGSKVAVNGASLVRRNGTSALVKSQEKKAFADAPFTEELRILPSDEDFSWAKDDYSHLQRTIDIWSFVLSLRVRVLFDNVKWTYLGGFSEEKQVINVEYVSTGLFIPLFIFVTISFNQDS